MAEKIVLEFRNIAIISLLVLLGIFLVLELQVTFGTPISFGDEGLYVRVSQYIAQEKDLPPLNPVIGNDLTGRPTLMGRPILWNLLESSFFLVLGFNDAISRFLVPFITVMASLATFVIMKRMFNDNIAFIAAIVLVAMPSVVTHAVLLTVDSLTMFYFILTVLLFVYGTKTSNKKYLWLSGLFLAFAFMTKNSAIGLYVFFFVAFFYELVTNRNFKEIFTRYATVILISLIFQGAHLINSFYYFHTPSCTLPYMSLIFDTSRCGAPRPQEVYQFDAPSRESGSEQSIYKMGLINFFEFAYGNIWLVPLGLIAGIVTFILAKSRESTLLLIMVITLLPFLHYSSTRAEDSARYLLGWTPFVAIFAAIYFNKIYEFLKTYQKYIALVVFVIVIVLSYQNFDSKIKVMKQVKQFSPLFFEACNWVKDNIKEDAILSTVWVYRALYNCQRKVVGNPADIYLNPDPVNATSFANKVGITHLFIQKFSMSNQRGSEQYLIDNVRMFENSPEYFKKVFENGPPLEQCIQQGGCDGNLIYEIV